MSFSTLRAPVLHNYHLNNILLNRVFENTHLGVIRMTQLYLLIGII